jgi:UDP-3-O-[3-hydroxymyristoyl] glucosamine N-acyltransferase
LVNPVAGDPRFFRRAGPFPLSRIAETIGETIEGLPGERLFSGVAPLQTAGPEQISFLTNRQYSDALRETRAGVVLLEPKLAHLVPSDTIALVSKRPVLAWARVAALFHPLPPLNPGIHPSAVIDPSARIAADAEIGPLSVVGAGAEIGARCRIGPLVSIGDGVVIGPDTRIGSHVSISHSLIGERVFILPGARLGQDGFGFDPTPTATGFISVPQLGRVVIEDDVEIGANSMIDRGSAQDTVVGAGSRLDNGVQIAHNVRLGRCCVIVSQAGISGSTTLDDYVTVAGQAGLTGHLHIGQGARIGAQAGVMTNVAPRSSVVGSPAEPVREFFRQVAFLRRMMRRDDAAKHETDAG